MNGAESLVKTLLGGGVDVCFTNPGTSEMHFVAALDAHADMRCVLGLQENIVTGAADGYARMTGKPAATLLHCGPGLGNGFANIHNARRSDTPMVNIVGDQATYHREYDAPLTTDVEAVAGATSHWVRDCISSKRVASDAADAIREANTAPGRIATLILPADTAWGAADGPAETMAPPAPPLPDGRTVNPIARILRSEGQAVLFLGGDALTEEGLQMAARIAQATGSQLLAQMSNARVERGAGRVPVDRLPYPVDKALERLAPYRHMVLIGAKDPVAFFAYPGKPSALRPKGCKLHPLAQPGDDVLGALEALAEQLGVADDPVTTAGLHQPPVPAGPLDPDVIAAAVASAIPENAIVVDEAITTGRAFFPPTFHAQPHSWLQINGGAIGIGMPLAAGAAIACPDRPVLTLEADGSGMYTPQALWTQAREGLNVTTVVFSNRSYQILLGEMAGVGVESPGPKALDMLELDRPPLDWPSLARGMGAEAGLAEDGETLVREIERGFACEGPYVIEARL